MMALTFAGAAGGGGGQAAARQDRGMYHKIWMCFNLSVIPFVDVCGGARTID